MKRWGLILTGFVFWSAIGTQGCVYAQPAAPVPSATVAVDKAAVTVGDPITYTVTVHIPAGVEVDSEPTAASGLDVFKIRNVDNKEQRDRAGNRIRTLTYTLVTFQLGKHTIPGYKIRYRAAGSADGQWTALSAQPVEITVNSVIADEKKAALQPLKPKLWVWPRWSWLFVVCGIALAVAAVFWLKRRRGQQAAAVPAPEPAYVIALRELDALDRAHLPEQGLFEEFFERLSGCLRRYLENRFQLRAPWMSTEEFMEAAKASPSLNGQQKNSLKAFLVLSDLVKFARYGSSPKEADEAFAAARNFVEQTKDAPAEGPNGTL